MKMLINKFFFSFSHFFQNKIYLCKFIYFNLVLLFLTQIQKFNLQMKIVLFLSVLLYLTLAQGLFFLIYYYHYSDDLQVEEADIRH